MGSRRRESREIRIALLAIREFGKSVDWLLTGEGKVISRQERNQGVSFRSDRISSCVSWPGYTESHVDMVLFSCHIPN